MAIGTKQDQILFSMICRVSIYVLDIKGNVPCQQILLCPATPGASATIFLLQITSNMIRDFTVTPAPALHLSCLPFRNVFPI
jgi:hypothetical protein